MKTYLKSVPKPYKHNQNDFLFFYINQNNSQLLKVHYILILLLFHLNLICPKKFRYLIGYQSILLIVLLWKLHSIFSFLLMLSI